MNAVILFFPFCISVVVLIISNWFLFLNKLKTTSIRYEKDVITFSDFWKIFSKLFKESKKNTFNWAVLIIFLSLYINLFCQVLHVFLGEAHTELHFFYFLVHSFFSVIFLLVIYICQVRKKNQKNKAKQKIKYEVTVFVISVLLLISSILGNIAPTYMLPNLVSLVNSDNLRLVYWVVISMSFYMLITVSFLWGHGAYNNDSLNDFLNNNEVKTSNFFATLGFASLGCFFIVALYLATAIILLHDKNKNGYSLSTPWNKTELCLMNTSLNLNSGAQPTEDIYFDSQASSNCDLNNIVTNYSKYHKERENLSITVTGYSTDEPTKSTFNLPSKEKSSEYSRFISNSLIKNNIEVTSELLADKDVRKVVNHVAKFMSLDTALRIITEKRENVNNTVDDYMQLNFLNTYSKPNPIKNDFYSLNKFCNKLKNELALNIICNYNDATFTISKENVRNVKIFFIESANKKLNKVLATKRAYMVANEFEDKYGVNIQDTNKFKIKGKASSCFGNDTKNKRTLSINKKNIIGCRQVEVTLHDYLTYTDALYFAAYTMTTTGYGDFQPNTNFIKMFTIYMNLHEFLFIALVISIFSTSVRSNRA